MHSNTEFENINKNYADCLTSNKENKIQINQNGFLQKEKVQDDSKNNPINKLIYNVVKKSNQTNDFVPLKYNDSNTEQVNI